MVTLKRKVGSSQIEVQAQDFKGICSADDLLGRLPDKCSLCGGTDLHFYHKTPKGFDYFGIRCRGCGAEQAFHTKQADGSFFIKWDDKFEKYQSGVSDDQVNKAFGGGPENFQSDDPNSIPF